MSPTLAVLLLAGAFGLWWLIDVRWHPWRKCPSCGGSRRNAGSRGSAWGDCGRCGKTGQVRRFGAGKGE